jgi:hypothetical protein
VELQGTAEGAAFSRAEMDSLLALADKGIRELVTLQRLALGGLSRLAALRSGPLRCAWFWPRTTRRSSLS